MEGRPPKEEDDVKNPGLSFLLSVFLPSSFILLPFLLSFFLSCSKEKKFPFFHFIQWCFRSAVHKTDRQTDTLSPLHPRSSIHPVYSIHIVYIHTALTLSGSDAEGVAPALYIHLRSCIRCTYAPRRALFCSVLFCIALLSLHCRLRTHSLTLSLTGGWVVEVPLLGENSSFLFFWSLFLLSHLGAAGSLPPSPPLHSVHSL